VRLPEVSPQAFSDVEAFAQLRKYTLELVGLDEAGPFLYRIGFDRGWRDGAQVSSSFSGGGVVGPRFAGPALPLLFLPTEGRAPEQFSGSLSGSLEAAVHRADFPPGEEKVCHLTAGYAAGWYSAMFRKTILVLEDRCEARGDESCHFEARPLQSWVEAEDSRALALLPCLDPPDVAEYTEEEDEAEPGEDGTLLGQFDPMSPAVHVWGPVMVLPYAGIEDADGAIDAVEEDLGPEAVRVVVVDLTGLHVAPVELWGVVELISRLESRGVEVVVAGIRGVQPEDMPPQLSGHDGPPIVQELAAGIALGFQIASAPDREN
jgi:hypothetical protein